MNKKYQNLSLVLEFRTMKNEQKLKTLKLIYYKIFNMLEYELETHDNVSTKKIKYLRSELQKVNDKINRLDKKISNSIGKENL